MGCPPVFAGWIIRKPGRRSAPVEVIRIEEATDPKRRARLQALSRRPAASARLRAHLAQIADQQKYRQPERVPTADDLPTIAGDDAPTLGPADLPPAIPH